MCTQLIQNGGSFSSDEAKYYESFSQKLIDRITVVKKAVQDNCRLIEQKRKTTVDHLVNKAMGKIAQHEVDVKNIASITKLLNTVQFRIKKEATAINNSLIETRRFCEVLTTTLTSKQGFASDQRFNSNEFLNQLTVMLKRVSL